MNSPWTIPAHVAADLDAIREADWQAELAVKDAADIASYYSKQKVIGMPLILDPEHPDFDPTIADV